ncbi:hypothetical protein [Mycolicibacterium vanbaalenii]|jgi:hypothetical protein|uniref:Uncharacterized protein n=1 Tax=Mycolicibacterium vanbaalenii (strain DSM 7251 / JCM 13017 / BCRC 16820 / KCTC 9966 / NRRL B-24157 / PYR-1) TaxID=350058 RepID=A1T881_MYCVP|nr:hypothetical protein [Mycolicibacterium vanbaalenii]ABM13381.1 hypothetical protein Mvan_2572 [Mycolicibacterium vanbaalenii PYR-1]MCV7128498.1 hypothetical protein [Mycolicibacterium vanbaalenii PYR-1]
MEKVTDPDGVEWTVRRWWWKTLPYETGFATLDAVILLIMLPFMLMWPFWLLAKWLGVPWTILVERDGEKVGRERVRGWRESRRRVSELAGMAAAGTMAQPGETVALPGQTVAQSGEDVQPSPGTTLI